MLKNILTIFFFILCCSIFAQETRQEKKKKAEEKVKKLQKDAEAGAIIFNKQSGLQVNLNTDGFSLGYENLKYKSIQKSSMWWFNIGERYSNKEYTQTQGINGIQIGNSFVYGKQNNFYYLKVGFGQQRLLGGKNFTNGVAVQAIYGGGLSLGMLKPYYLEVFKNATGSETEIIRFDDNKNKFVDPNWIVGGAPFGTGFGKIKFVPGAFAKTAVRFDYGRFNDVVSALEVGVQAEFYTDKMPIMISEKERNLFIQGYVSLIFGSRR